MEVLMPPYPLTHFKIQKCYKNEQNLMVFFQEIICLKNKKCVICNKS